MRWRQAQKKADFTHHHRRTVWAKRWRWGEGRKNNKRSRACSHTSRSYSRKGPGTRPHLQRNHRIWSASIWILSRIRRIKALTHKNISPPIKWDSWEVSCSFSWRFIHLGDSRSHNNCCMFWGHFMHSSHQQNNYCCIQITFIMKYF